MSWRAKSRSSFISKLSRQDIWEEQQEERKAKQAKQAARAKATKDEKLEAKENVDVDTKAIINAELEAKENVDTDNTPSVTMAKKFVKMKTVETRGKGMAALFETREVKKN